VSTLRKDTERFLAAWMRARQIVQASNFNRFHQAGLSATQFMALNQMPAEGISLSELARKLNLSPATLNETVNSLEGRGLVSREPDPADKRRIRIVLTPGGTEMQNASSRQFHDAMAQRLARMSATARRALVSGLEEFTAEGREE
jgi:DNA-binding MarR family transcriptional regulator